LTFQPDEAVRLGVLLDDETVWLTQAQMVELFGTSKQNVSLHINNIFKEGELSADVVIKESLTTTQHGAIEGKAQLKDLGKKLFAFSKIDIKPTELLKHI
jgi:hypothetical protein